MTEKHYINVFLKITINPVSYSLYIYTHTHTHTHIYIYIYDNNIFYTPYFFSTKKHVFENSRFLLNNTGFFVFVFLVTLNSI